MSSDHPFILEICASSLPSALTAAASGADRIELCASLDVGGLTPSYGLIHTVLSKVSIPVHVLIRPRAGGFVYSKDEVEIMKADIEVCRELGAAGVVVGVLKEGEDGELVIDVVRCKELMQCAGDLDVTFHRAFDDCADHDKALEDVVATGCGRVLTSGGQDTALDGELRIRMMVKRAGGRVAIMPGSGVRPDNIGGLYERTGAREFHASASQVVDGSSVEKSSRFRVTIKETNGNVVERLKEGLTKAFNDIQG